MRVLDILKPRIQNQRARSHAIDLRIQAFVAVRFYATAGDFYTSTSSHHGISEASVCRIKHKVRI